MVEMVQQEAMVAEEGEEGRRQGGEVLVEAALVALD